MRTIILGTDWWTDCDDVAAVRIACRADKAGLWKLGGIVLDACMPLSAAALNAFLTYEGYGELPIGIDREGTDFKGVPVYQKTLVEYPHSVRDNDAVSDGLELYLDILREAEGDVDILEIGFPQVLAALCAHPEGRRLMAEKVNCLWMMAGKFDENGRGFEHNINNNRRSSEAAAYLFENSPCPIMLLGWEVGSTVISGGPETVAAKDDLLRVAFDAHGSVNGRFSWDPMLVLLALAKDPEKAGYDVRRGWCHADPVTGENWFDYDEKGKHAYVVKKMPDEWYEKQLHEWLKA